jgi:hypothetical protein
MSGTDDYAPWFREVLVKLHTYAVVRQEIADAKIEAYKFRREIEKQQWKGKE